MHRRPNAFTLIELLVVIAIISVLISILMPSLSKARQAARQLKDSTSIRSLVQGMAIWGGSNKDEYPTPSRHDRSNATMLAACSYEKDNTGNMLSILVFNGYMPVQVLVSSAEVDKQRYAVDDGYQYGAPDRAAFPDQALWDPGFSGMPGEVGTTGIGGGRRGAFTANTSFAHTTLFGSRLTMWATTFSSSEAVFSNRGPQYEGSAGAWRLAPGPTGLDSTSIRIFGKSPRWAGNIGFNDGHVSFENDPSPDTLPVTYGVAVNGTRSHRDNIFVIENLANGLPMSDYQADAGRDVYLRQYMDVQCLPTGIRITPNFD